MCSCIVYHGTAQRAYSDHFSDQTSLPSPFRLCPLEQLRSATYISVICIYETSTQVLEPTSKRRESRGFGSGVDLIEARCCSALVSLTKQRLGQRLCLSDFPNRGNELLASGEANRDGLLLSIQHTNLEVELSRSVLGYRMWCRTQPDSRNPVQRSLDKGGEGDENEPSVAHIFSPGRSGWGIVI
jgi:hypothetical protein